MPAPFSCTLRSLQADRGGRASVTLAGLGLLAAWFAWFLLARVTVYEVADQARLEVVSAAHSLATPVDGRVVECTLGIGRDVTAGEVLLRLDARAEQKAYDETQVRCQALQARAQALADEIQAEEKALLLEDRARCAAREEAQAQIAEAESRVRLAQTQADTSERLYIQHVISREEHHRDRSQLETSQAALRAALAARVKLDEDRAAGESGHQARLARLRRDRTELEGDRAVAEATGRRLQHEIERRQIRAPVTGRIGQVGDIRVGSVVRAAEKLAAIVPQDDARVVAFFPADGVGRLRPGQPARLRLDGYPWAQYGTVAAEVREVGSEAREGLVRVELDLKAGPPVSMPIEHGMPGKAEVAVEQVAPAVLVLRTAGQFLSPRRSPGRPETPDNPPSGRELAGPGYAPPAE